MNPKHNNPTRPKYTAHAPYNFVPLPEKAIPAPENLPGMDQYYDERYSGVIGCKITTRSPVYVRGMAEPDFFAELKEKPVHEMDDKKSGSTHVFIAGMTRDCLLFRAVHYGE